MSFDNRLERVEALSELAHLDAKASRYVAESIAGLIDEEGKIRLRAILDRKAELRLILQKAAK
jgi:hypothetical protein